MQRHRDRVRGNQVGDPLKVEDRGPLVASVGVADGGREDVHPGLAQVGERHLGGLLAGFLVGAHPVLLAGDRLDLALDVGAVAAGLGHHLDRLPLVLLDRQQRGVEEDGVPALGQAVADHLPLGAVIEVQTGRHLDATGHRLPHRVEHAGADRLHGLHRGLDDDRRPGLHGTGEHILHGEVVDDVDRGHPVPLLEGGLQDVCQGCDGHDASLDAGRCRHPKQPAPATEWGITHPRPGGTGVGTSRTGRLWELEGGCR